MDTDPNDLNPDGESEEQLTAPNSRRRLILGATSAVAGGFVASSVLGAEPAAADDLPVRSVTASTTAEMDDKERTIEANHATTDITVTIPTNTSVAFPLNSELRIRQTGPAPVTVAPATGVTLRTTGGDKTLACGGIWGEVVARKRGTDEWVLSRRDVPGGSGMMRFAYDLVADFGADPTGVRDSTAAVQAAINAPALGSAGVYGAQVQVPPGSYRITDTIVVNRWAGSLVGSGVANDPNYTAGRGNGSVFRWDGEAGKPMFQLFDCLVATFRHLRFQGNNTKPPSAAIRSLGQGGTGTNSRMVVEDCIFGSYVWTMQGLRQGALKAGIVFDDDDGNNVNNDEFRIVRCQFEGDASVTDGVALDIPTSTQSVWGSVTDCLFNNWAVGLRTSSSVTLSNPQFNRCDRDIEVRSTCTVHVNSWQSEHSSQLAKIEPYAKLLVFWGRLQVTDLPALPGQIIDMVPSQNNVLDLNNVEFFGAYPAAGQPQPTIRFGPQAPYTGIGFRVRVDHPIGLAPELLELGGTMTATSRGIVQYESTGGSTGPKAFRNVLYGAGRTTLDRTAYDLPDGAVTGGPISARTLRLTSLTANPTGAAVVGEIVVVNGVVKVCTVAGTPGTWTVIGSQT